MADRIIIGLDPSSKKIAMAISVNGGKPTLRTKALPANNMPYQCHVSRVWVQKVVMEYTKAGHFVFLFIESPVVGRGGVRSTLVQTKTNGAMQAGAYAGGAEVTEVNNTTWKKTVIGNGNAGKPLIKSTLKDIWPYLYDLADGDQDLLDAGAILRHGEKVILAQERINQDMGITDTPPKRATPTRRRLAPKK